MLEVKIIKQIFRKLIRVYFYVNININILFNIKNLR